MAAAHSEPRSLTLVASPGLQQELQDIGEPLSRPRGTVLFRRGDSNAGAFLVRQGTVRLFLRNRRGTLVSDRRMGPGSLLGLPSTLNRRPYSLEAEALEDLELIFIASSSLHAFVRASSQGGREVLEILARELTAIQSLAAEL
ncbi:MAG TPA: cyclic nucleotide-binding domain-containing protein [Terriglobales bacterium]|nr:cyclic nucleotide-binding domain-containing protein [Terriglobales bacterium]